MTRAGSKNVAHMPSSGIPLSLSFMIEPDYDGKARPV